MSGPLPLRCAVALLGLAFLAGCSSFDRQWKAASKGGGAATRWDGRWASGTRRDSDGSAHGGRLRCVLTPEAGNRYAASFHANWLIFSGNYSMTLEPVTTGAGRVVAGQYRGSHELPAIFGGTYRYEATIRGRQFNARYDSSVDHGTFTLQQVGSTGECVPSHAQH